METHRHIEKLERHCILNSSHRNAMQTMLSETTKINTKKIYYSMC